MPGPVCSVGGGNLRIDALGFMGGPKNEWRRADFASRTTLENKPNSRGKFKKK